MIILIHNTCNYVCMSKALITALIKIFQTTFSKFVSPNVKHINKFISFGMCEIFQIKGMNFSFPSLKLPNKENEEYSKIILFIPFHFVLFPPSKRGLRVFFVDVGRMLLSFASIQAYSTWNISLLIFNMVSESGSCGYGFLSLQCV